MLPIFTAQNAQPLAPAASTRLLRNFGELAPAGTPYAGLPIASGTWWGLTGSEIAASAGVGEHGPGLLANDSLAPDAEYRLVVRNSTFAPDALVVQEDGAVEYLGPGTAVYDLYEANLLLPGGPAAVSGGFAPAQYAGALASMQSARSMQAVVGSYSSLSYSGQFAAMQVAVSMPAFSATYTPPAVEQAPTILQNPRSITVQAGRYAAFQVSSLGAISYQWRRNGAPIAGATRAAYTTDPVQTSDTGAVFEVHVTNTVGMTASAPATLTVVAAAAARTRASAQRVLRIKPEGPATTYRVD